MLPLEGQLLAAIDFETSGLLAGYHEPVQVALVALGPHLRPLSAEPFYRLIRPEHLDRADPGAMKTHKIPPERLLEAASAGDVADDLIAWVAGFGVRQVVPLAHSWPFEYSFLNAWLGISLMQSLFSRDARDTRQMAVSENDRARWGGRPLPYPKNGLGDLCRQFGVVNEGPHDALWDAVAEAEVYRCMLQSA